MNARQVHSPEEPLMTELQSDMRSFYAMRRANGDWFAIDDSGHLRMPIFQSSGQAMVARSRDSGMECFRPVAFDASALEEIRKSNGVTASFLLVNDPSRKLKHGLLLSFAELAPLMVDLAKDRSKH